MSPLFPGAAALDEVQVVAEVACHHLQLIQRKASFPVDELGEVAWIDPEILADLVRSDPLPFYDAFQAIPHHVIIHTTVVS